MKDFLYILRSTPLAMFVIAAAGFKLTGSNLCIAIGCGFVLGVALMDVMYCLVMKRDEPVHKGYSSDKGLQKKIITSISILIYYSIIILIAGLALLKTYPKNEIFPSRTVLSVEIHG